MSTSSRLGHRRGPGSTRWASRLRVPVALLAVGVLAAACSSSGSPAATSTTSSGSGGSGGPAAAWLTQAKATVQGLQHVSATIWSARLGHFTPPKGLTLYYVGSPPVAEGIQNFGKGVAAAAQVLGYKVKTCFSATTSGTSLCFSEAINAHPSVILTNGTSQIANGSDWARVKAAGIPMIAAFSGDPSQSPNVTAEVAGAPHCYNSGVYLADGIIAQTNGKANILFFAESAYACDVRRRTALRRR